MSTHLRAALLGIAVLAAACAAPSALPIDADRFGAHVAWMADDARAGRQTGSPELMQTADYVVQQFAAAGLEPGARRGRWKQWFQARGQRELKDGNRLRLGGRDYPLQEAWVPFATAASADVEGALAFAGYGITDEESGYDDYAGIDLSDRIVVVLRRSPRAWEEDGDGGAPAHAAAGPHGGAAPAPFHETRWQGHRTFASKINNAYKHGAAGLLVVNDPRSTPPGDEEDVLAPYGTATIGGVGASLPAAQLTAAAGQRLMEGLGYDLEALQALIDERGAPSSALIDEARAELTVRSGRREVDTVNVVGWLPGRDPSGEYVVLGAHMDHIGRGLVSGSRGGADVAGEIHNGADDNASGTAGLMEIAHLLTERDDLRRGVVFIAFGAEEWGLLGSRWWVEHPGRPIEDCVAMVNMDMIGRSVDGYVSVEGVGSAAGFRELVLAADERAGTRLDLHFADDPAPNSDQAAFHDVGIPVIALFTGLHEDYHMPGDDTGKVNVEGGAAIASLAAEIVTGLANADVRPEFVAPVPRHAAPADPHAAPDDDAPAVIGYGVVFGTSPDMTYQAEDGVKIASVREGTPAAKAGVRAGDRIVAMGGKPIRNLEDYAVLLFSHRPGDEITVTVVRGGSELDITAVLEGKSGDQ